MHLKNGLSKRRHYSTVVLHMGFGNSVIYRPNILEKNSTSTNSKTFVVVVSPLEYIRKQQVVSQKRTWESAELDREI